MSSPSWKAIAAMSENRVIGNKGSIPWHIPEDFQWVKKTTSGHTLVMGRKTYDSIGKPLPRRDNVILSRSAGSIEGCHVIRSLDEVDSLNLQGDIYIFGGEEVYRLAMPKVAEIFLTIVHREVEGDAFFPSFEDDFELTEIIKKTSEYRICHYKRLSLVSNEEAGSD